MAGETAADWRGCKNRESASNNLQILTEAMKTTKCAVASLLLSPILLGSAACALAADAGGGNDSASANRLIADATNAASTIQTDFVFRAIASATSAVLTNFPALTPGFNPLAEDCIHGLEPGWLDRCMNVASNTLALASAACCERAGRLGSAVDWSADGLARNATEAKPRGTFRFFDGALISAGGPGGEAGARTNREEAFFAGGRSGQSWVGPDSARKSQGLRLFRWSW